MWKVSGARTLSGELSFLWTCSLDVPRSKTTLVKTTPLPCHKNAILISCSRPLTCGQAQKRRKDCKSCYHQNAKRWLNGWLSSELSHIIYQHLQTNSIFLGCKTCLVVFLLYSCGFVCKTVDSQRHSCGPEGPQFLCQVRRLVPCCRLQHFEITWVESRNETRDEESFVVRGGTKCIRLMSHTDF